MEKSPPLQSRAGAVNSTARIVMRFAVMRGMATKMLVHQVTSAALSGEYFAASAAIVLVSRNAFVRRLKPGKFPTESECAIDWLYLPSGQNQCQFEVASDPNRGLLPCFCHFLHTSSPFAGSCGVECAPVRPGDVVMINHAIAE
jgi:hypothetical protein